MNDQTGQERLHVTHRVTLVSIITNTLLSVAQLVGGLVTHSQGLIADGIHTLSDLLSDFVVWIAAKEAAKSADAEHPYGHGRIETLATVILGGSLAGVSVAIGLDAVDRIQNPERLLTPSIYALGFAALAVVSKEALYQYTVWTARHIHSRMLEANAWHHRSDAISSLMVIIGIAGTLLGLPFMDAVGALLVAVMIGYMGYKLVRKSLEELIDTSLDKETTDKIINMVSQLDGVVDVHMLRTRQSGGYAIADIHIQVAPKITVSEGHQIAENVRLAIMQSDTPLTDITVHIDPENDETAKPCAHLPLRTQVGKDLRKAWGEQIKPEWINGFNLHYLDGQIDITLLIHPHQLSEEDIARLASDLKHSTSSIDYIRHVSILQNRA